MKPTSAEKLDLGRITTYVYPLVTIITTTTTLLFFDYRKTYDFVIPVTALICFLPLVIINGVQQNDNLAPAIRSIQSNSLRGTALWGVWLLFSALWHDETDRVEARLGYIIIPISIIIGISSVAKHRNVSNNSILLNILTAIMTLLFFIPYNMPMFLDNYTLAFHLIMFLVLFISELYVFVLNGKFGIFQILFISTTWILIVPTKFVFFFCLQASIVGHMFYQYYKKRNKQGDLNKKTVSESISIFTDDLQTETPKLKNEYPVKQNYMPQNGVHHYNNQQITQRRPKPSNIPTNYPPQNQQQFYPQGGTPMLNQPQSQPSMTQAAFQGAFLAVQHMIEPPDVTDKISEIKQSGEYKRLVVKDSLNKTHKAKQYLDRQIEVYKKNKIKNPEVLNNKKQIIQNTVKHSIDIGKARQENQQLQQQIYQHQQINNYQQQQLQQLYQQQMQQPPNLHSNIPLSNSPTTNNNPITSFNDAIKNNTNHLPTNNPPKIEHNTNLMIDIDDKDFDDLQDI